MFFWFPIALGGAVAGGAMSTVLYPFEIMKTNLQMRNAMMKETAHHSYFSKGYVCEVWVILKDLTRRQHFRTIRVGLAPMFFMSGLTTLFRFNTYQFAYSSEFLSTATQDVLHPRAILFCGAMGTLQQLVMNPANMMKTKLQYWTLCESTMNKEDLKDITFWKVGKNLYKKLGTRIFNVGWGCCIYRGFLASVVQMVVYQSMIDEVLVIESTYFSSYGLTENEWDAARFSSALCAGLLSTICVSPFDVVLTRMHTQPYQINMRGLFYSNSHDAILKVVKHEGYYALYKGVFFLWARHGVVAAASQLFWDSWKDRMLMQIQRKNAPAFIQQDIVQYSFDNNDLFCY